MSRSFWVGLGVIGIVQWVALDVANYLGRRQGHHEAMETVRVFDAGLAAGNSVFRLCSERTAPGDATAKPSKTGSTR